MQKSAKLFIFIFLCLVIKLPAADAVLPVGLRLSVLDVVSVQGEARLVIQIKNVTQSPLAIEINMLHQIMDDCEVVDDNKLHVWANLSSTPIIMKGKRGSLRLVAGEILSILIELPPSELFSKSDFSQTIHFEHEAIKGKKQSFNVSRKNGKELTFKRVEK